MTDTAKMPSYDAFATAHDRQDVLTIAVKHSGVRSTLLFLNDILRMVKTSESPEAYFNVMDDYCWILDTYVAS